MSPCPWHWVCREITHSSATHIANQGSQITARQMESDGCLGFIWEDLPRIWCNEESSKICFSLFRHLTAVESLFAPSQPFERALLLTLSPPLLLSSSIDPCRLDLWPSAASVTTMVTLWKNPSATLLLPLNPYKALMAALLTHICFLVRSSSIDLELNAWWVFSIFFCSFDLQELPCSPC